MPSPRIQFRATKSGKELEERTSLPQDIKPTEKDALISDTAERDLERYYAVLKLTLARIPTFTESEAMLLVDSLNGYLLTPEMPHLLWANVADAIHMDGLDKKWDVDGAALINRLREMTPFEQLAISDAVERAWQSETYQVSNMEEKVRAVGLVKEPRKGLEVTE